MQTTPNNVRGQCGTPIATDRIWDSNLEDGVGRYGGGSDRGGSHGRNEPTRACTGST